ncbi:MAG: DUF456 domain-containing protein [Planctomycetota bacterium]
MGYLIGSAIIAAAWLGVLLTLVLLPGMWIAVLVAMVGQFLTHEPLMSWWTIGVAALIAAIGEIVETFASAAGAKQFGASKAGMTAAVVGSFAGAIAGTIFIPIPVVGTLTGALLGAGLSTVAVERGTTEKTWKQSAAAGGGAAAGKAVSVFAKAGLAAVQSTVLTVAVLVP